MKRACLLLVSSYVLFASSARAEEPTKSYAAQTLLADGASVALVVGGVAADAAGGGDAAMNAIAVPGLVGFALATPILHAVHGNWGASAGSFALRFFGVPFAALAGGIVIGPATCGPSPAGADTGVEIGQGLGCFVRGAAIGAGLGAVLISAFDAAVLAKERAPAPHAPSSAFVPTLGASPRGATVGVAAAF